MKKLFWVLAAAAALSMSSCQKEDTASTINANEETAIDGDQVDGIYDEVASEVDQVTLGLKSDIAPESSGTRTVTTANNNDGTYTKTVTFANWKIGKNQRWMKNGQIIINVNVTTLTRTVTFNNFTINGRKIEGTKIMVLNPQTNTLTITLKDGKVTFADGTTYTQAFTKVWTKVAGVDTPLNVWDDEYDITVDATGVNRRGKAYTETTTTPLHLKTIWPVFVSGEVTRVVDSMHTIVTNYGAGTEDFLVTITVDGVSKEVNLLDKK
ncbi:hypothetical protein [uncultured Acetobacteroides sp.]|uniref:hypothetical protein n=1 Tax=uncultured Acetobacteroides sp. TaxID=1760811 RepID=UPI0029F51C6B|nr:hypothetical protein [uncultured Acetobacteroides sp.]